MAKDKVRSFDEKKREKEAMDALEAEAVAQLQTMHQNLRESLEGMLTSMEGVIIIGVLDGQVRAIAGSLLDDRLEALGALEDAKQWVWHGFGDEN